MKTLLKLCVIASLILIFSSCFFANANQNSGGLPKKDEQSLHVKSKVIIPTVKQIINTLCSDKFQGRKVGSEGNKEAGNYIEKIFKDIGLAPLFNNSYYEKYTQKLYEKIITIKKVNNVVGIINGKSSKKAVIISAHFDHLGIKDGKTYKGALDNASGVAALINIARILKDKSKEKPFDTNIILCAFNGEESFRGGSKAFVNDIKSKSFYSNVYNINIDCIGAKNGGGLALVNKSKVSNKLYNAIKNTMKKHHINFENTHMSGISDYMSFEYDKIANVEIQQDTIRPLIHKSTDTPDILEYNKIYEVINAICDFVETNDGVIFKN